MALTLKGKINGEGYSVNVSSLGEALIQGEAEISVNRVGVPMISRCTIADDHSASRKPNECPCLPWDARGRRTTLCQAIGFDGFGQSEVRLPCPKP